MSQKQGTRALSKPRGGGGGVYVITFLEMFVTNNILRMPKYLKPNFLRVLMTASFILVLPIISQGCSFPSSFDFQPSYFYSNALNNWV